MLKRTMNILLWSLLLAGVVSLMGFAEMKRNHTKCKALSIRVLRNDSNFFITPAEIRALIKGTQGDITSKNMDAIDMPALERALKANPFIDEAQVFASLDGTIDVTITQKKPIVRIIPENGDGFYIDTKGNLMPLSPDYAALTLVANGNINDGYDPYFKCNMMQLQRDTAARSILPAIYKLAIYISRNPFWKAQITEVYVDTARDFYLIPRVGNQRIVFGDTTNMDQKFNKLWILYRQGLNVADKWNAYSEINLKYKHQVICTKK